MSIPDYAKDEIMGRTDPNSTTSIQKPIGPKGAAKAASDGLPDVASVPPKTRIDLTAEEVHLVVKALRSLVFDARCMISTHAEGKWFCDRKREEIAISERIQARVIEAVRNV